MLDGAEALHHRLRLKDPRAVIGVDAAQPEPWIAAPHFRGIAGHPQDVVANEIDLPGVLAARGPVQGIDHCRRDIQHVGQVVALLTGLALQCGATEFCAPGEQVDEGSAQGDERHALSGLQLGQHRDVARQRLDHPVGNPDPEDAERQKQGGDPACRHAGILAVLTSGKRKKLSLINVPILHPLRTRSRPQATARVSTCPPRGRCTISASVPNTHDACRARPHPLAAPHPRPHRPRACRPRPWPWARTWAWRTRPCPWRHRGRAGWPGDRHCHRAEHRLRGHRVRGRASSPIHGPDGRCRAQPVGRAGD